MKLFKNKVGRPTNKIKNKRKTFIISIVISIILLIGITFFCVHNLIINKTNSNKLKGSSFLYYYSQDDSNWSDRTYCDSTGYNGTIKQTYGGNACGPTAMAMVVSNLKNKKITPVTIGEEVKKTKYCSNKWYGTKIEFIPYIANKYNLYYERFTKDQSGTNGARAVLKQGGYVIAYMKKSPMANSLHYVVIYSIDNNDQVMVANPKSSNFPSKQGPYKLSDFNNKDWIGPGWYGVSNKKCPSYIKCPSKVKHGKEFTCVTDTPGATIGVSKVGLAKGYNKKFITKYSDMTKQTKYNSVGMKKIAVSKKGCKTKIKKVKVY